MNEILIGVSTYNELENLPTLVEQIDRNLPNAHLLIVDDNSPDGTGDWCDQQAKVRPHFSTIQRSGKLGLGSATLATMQYAIDHEYRLLINMDADLSHPPQSLGSLVAAMDINGRPQDVAIGSRYIQGGKIIGWPLRRRAMSRCVNGFARWSLGLSCRDCSGSFRCYRVSKLRELDFASIRSRGYSFFEEILWHLDAADADFTEVPITFQDRERGESKINLREAWRALRIITQLGIQTKLGIKQP